MLEHPFTPLHFDFAMPGRIMFGAGRFAELGGVAAGLLSSAPSRRVCLVTGGRSLAKSGKLEALLAQFKAARIEHLHVCVTGEPTVEAVDELVALARDFKTEAVVGVGGGSVLDAAKAVAALLTNSGSALDYLEGVGTGAILTQRAKPFVAVPTTAGTGSEATKNAVLGDRAKTFKKSMRSDSMLAAVALVDPELTYDCPADITAACGMDAVVQLIESFVSTRATPLTEAWCTHGLQYTHWLPDLVFCLRNAQGEVQENVPDITKMREKMCVASLLGGFCLANAGLGGVHGIASPVGAHFPIPHGEGCGALLLGVMRANMRRAVDKHDFDLLVRYHFAAVWMGYPFDVSRMREWVEPFLLWLDAWVGRIGPKKLSHFGISRGDFPRIIAGARGNSMKTNPVELSDADLEAILESAL